MPESTTAPTAVDIEALSKKKPEETTFAELVRSHSSLLKRHPFANMLFRASMHNCVKHVKSSISNTPPRSKRNRFHGHLKAVISLDWHKRVRVKQQPLHFLSFKSFGRIHNHFSPVSWLLPGIYTCHEGGSSTRKLMLHICI